MGHSQVGDCGMARNRKNIKERTIQSSVGRRSGFNVCRVLHSTFEYLRKRIQYDLPSDKANATQLGAFYENYAIVNT